MRSILSTKILTQASDRTARNRMILPAAGFVVAAVFAYGAAQLILRGDLGGLFLVALAFGGVAVAVAVLNDWRRGVYAFFTWLLIEDLFRKFLQWQAHERR